MGDQHAEERLADTIDLGSKGAAFGLGEGRVDGDEGVGRLDQVGVDEDAALAAGVGVNRDVLGERVSFHVVSCTVLFKGGGPAAGLGANLGDR